MPSNRLAFTEIVRSSLAKALGCLPAGNASIGHHLHCGIGSGSSGLPVQYNTATAPKTLSTPLVKSLSYKVNYRFRNLKSLNPLTFPKSLNLRMYLSFQGLEAFFKFSSFNDGCSKQ
jgi:hypothetical protein